MGILLIKVGGCSRILNTIGAFPGYAVSVESKLGAAKIMVNIPWGTPSSGENMPEDCGITFASSMKLPMLLLPISLLAACASPSGPSRAHVRSEEVHEGMIRTTLQKDDAPTLNRIVLAVLPLNTSTDIRPDGNALAEILSERASHNDRVKVVERVRIKAVFDELLLGDTGPVSEDTAIKIGNLLGANVLLLGSAISNGDHRIVTLRLVKVETGEIFGGSTETTKGDVAAEAQSEYDKIDALITQRAK